MRVRSFVRTSVLAVVVSTAASQTASAGANLVTNGSFETGDFTGWSTVAAGVGSNFTVQSGSGWDGTHAALFSATGGQYDQIFQDLNTEVGQTYLLEFWIMNLGLENDGLLVKWGNQTLLDGPVQSELETYVYFSFEVTALSSLTELRFGGFDGSAGFYLDNISVTLIPAPAGLAMLGIAGLSAGRRRRRA